MKTTHTPGKWYTKKGGHDFHINSESGSGNDIALVRQYKDLSEAEANARLMAAAPELLEALREMEESAVAFCDEAYSAPEHKIEAMQARLHNAHLKAIRAINNATQKENF